MGIFDSISSAAGTVGSTGFTGIAGHMTGIEAPSVLGTLMSGDNPLAAIGDALGGAFDSLAGVLGIGGKGGKTDLTKLLLIGGLVAGGIAIVYVVMQE